MNAPDNSWTAQQTNEWFMARIGRFTSSEIHKLMGVKSLGVNDELSDTAKTYVYEKYAEFTTGIAKEIKSWALDWGNENEPLAKLEMEQRNGCDMMDCEFILHPTYFYLGGSPDGVIVKHGINHMVEIKCPANTAEQYKNISAAKDAVTMRKKYPELYWQMQNNMMLTKLTNGLFVSYDKRIKIGNGGYFEKVIERNDADIELILQQVAKAWEMYQNLAEADGINLYDYLMPEHKDKMYAAYNPKAQAAREELAQLEKQWEAEKTGAAQSELFKN